MWIWRIEKMSIKQNVVKNNKYEILTPNGWEDFEGVKKTEDASIPLVKIETSSHKIKCTPNHRLYLEGEETFAKDLKEGDLIETESGSEAIVSINEEDTGEVYDIWNSEKHIIWANGVKSHQCDEFAFVPPGQADEFWSANYPTISESETARIIIISTPCGMHNLFHQIYTSAVDGKNSFAHLKISWQRVPGRDKKWAEEQIGNIGKLRFAQEYAVEFLGSSNTVIDPDILEHLLKQYREPGILDLNNRFRVYEKPQPGAMYVAGVDTSKGTGEHYSTVQVLKMNALKPVDFEQVAVFEDNFTDVYSFAGIVNRISHYYNQAYLMVENNAEGINVVNELWWKYENQNLINEGAKSTKLGIRATKRTKPQAVLMMKKMIEDGTLKLMDERTIQQLTAYIDKGNGTFSGNNMSDDLVSALHWACFILKFDIFDETYEFKSPNEDDVEAWGVLSDVEMEEDWSWLYK